MIVEKQMECRLARKTEVLGENLPQRRFCPSQNPTRPDLGLNPGRRGEDIPITGLGNPLGCERVRLPHGRAIAQAVIRWLPTAAARV
jgi:hypothetical protein